MRIRKEIKSLLVIGFCFGFLPIISVQNTNSIVTNPGPFFYIDVLALDTDPLRNQWATIITQQFPKIGIGIDTFDLTGWVDISPRTWGHPGPYPIRTYDEGGYDVFFFKWGWGIDIDMRGLFDTPSQPPDGDNFYQYSRPEMDWAIGNYSQSYNQSDRLFWTNEIQQLLYEDLPAITLFYPQTLYPHDENLSGWDEQMWLSSYQPMENWTISNQTEFHYATNSNYTNFHIYLRETSADNQWLNQIYNGLLIRDSKTKGFANRIASSWNSVDGLTYNIQLNPNAVWADGHVLNATDVKYSFELLIDPVFTPRNHFCTPYLTNESVNIISEFALEITFNHHYVFQDSILATEIVPKHIWETIAPINQSSQALTWAMDDFLDSQKIIGAGPYYLEDFDEINYIIKLKRNDYFDDWTGVTPYFEHIYFEYYPSKENALAALVSGDIDMVDDAFNIMKGEIPFNSGVSYTAATQSKSDEIALNMLHPYFGTGELCPIPGLESAKHIRKAISYMIPREHIIMEVLNGLGEPGITPYPSAAFGFNDSLEPYEYSLYKAKEHMSKAGFYIPEITSVRFGLNIPILFSIIALIGGCYFFIRRKS